MKVSLQIANQYSNVNLLSIPVDEMLVRIGAQLGAVEEVIDVGTRFKGVVVAKIISCQKHSNADKLNVCLIDDGRAVPDVERNADGLVQVVCGAPNVREGISVAWIPPGATVPSTYSTDPFVLEARELRGVISNGMLASAHELGISDDHAGILEINQDVAPGKPFVELYGLQDVVIDCENKMFTHRPDCFGILGVARELAGINGLEFRSPDWYNLDSVQPSPTGSLTLVSQNNVVEKVPRFMVQVVEGVSIKPSSIEIQSALSRLGSRPINNIVDLTNYYMLLTAQPTHAFDYDKVKALCGGDQVTIFPRMAEEGETLELLNGKTVKLTADDIVIATDKQAIALGGIMGGAATEVDANTKNIIVECANFDMYTIRRTSMRHGLFTDAVTRFNKGQSYLQNPVVLQKLVSEICQAAGGTAGLLYDSTPEEDKFIRLPVQVTTDFINARLGSQLTADDISRLLNNVELMVEIAGDQLEVTPPFWRTDIELPEDIVEEVGRLYGYDKLPVYLPYRSSAPLAKNPALKLNSKLRDLLAKAGANEVLSYSFVSGQLIETAQQNAKEAYQLSNAISPELQYYRLTLTPSLLARVNQNLRAGYDKFALFELGRTHLKLQGVNDEGLPLENPLLSLVYAANDRAVAKDEGAAYYQAKRYLEYIADEFDLTLDYEVLADEVKYEITKPFQPGRAALVTDRNSGSYIGVIGEYKPAVRSKLKLPTNSAGFEIMLTPLLEIGQKLPYQALAKFPGISQDITLSVAKAEAYSHIEGSIQRAIASQAAEKGMVVTVKPINIYHKDESKDKNLSFRLDVHHPDRTLTTEEATKFVDEVVALVQKETGAKRI